MLNRQIWAAEKRCSSA